MQVSSRAPAWSAFLCSEGFRPPPSHNQNAMTKFADDTYLLVGSNCITTVADEIANMKDGAVRNNMRIHPTKTKELVICYSQLHPALSSREPNVPTPSGSWEFSSTRGYRWETTSHKFLTLAPLPHNALRILRSHGLQPNELHLVARATTVASILYASPAWYGFANEGGRKRLERLLARMRRCGYLPRDFPCLAALVDGAD